MSAVQVRLFLATMLGRLVRFSASPRVALVGLAAMALAASNCRSVLGADLVQFAELDIVGAQSILNTGTLIEANNFGDGNPQNGLVNGAPPLVVNGVSFGTDTSALVNGTASWVFAGGPLNDYSLVFNNSDPQLDALLSGSANFPANSTAILRLTGLHHGYIYRLQVPATHDTFHPSVVADRRWFVNLDGGPDYDFLMNGGGDGRLPDSLVVTFKADSERTDLNIRGGIMPHGVASDVHIMGYALHLVAIPEPTGMVLLCIGVCILGIWRQKRGCR